MERLLRRANALLKEQTVLVAEFQKLKLELLKRNREALELHQRFPKQKKRD
jgi:hypothetical protein